MSRIDELVSDPETKCSAWIEEVRQCVSEERERCAKIAEKYGAEPMGQMAEPGEMAERQVAGESIAERIREGK